MAENEGTALQGPTAALWRTGLAQIDGRSSRRDTHEPVESGDMGEQDDRQ